MRHGSPEVCVTPKGRSQPANLPCTADRGLPLWDDGSSIPAISE